MPARRSGVTGSWAQTVRLQATIERPIVDVPTLLVAVAIAVGFCSMFLFGGRLPWPVTVVGLGVLSAWYGSLQHEVVHGQPTRSHRINHAIVWLPLNVTYPFRRYLETHSEHHTTNSLTIPGLDPESNFVTADAWASFGRVRRGWLRSHRTISGRMCLGPLRSTALFIWSEATLVRRRANGVASAWGHHLGGGVAVGAIVAVSEITWWEYVVGAGYLGLSLTMLRSFAEHLDVTSGTRTAHVEAGRFFSLLYLNNNLHHAHHAFPGLPWHELPRAGRELGSAEISAAGAGRYSGYGELFRRYSFRPLHHPVNVLTNEPS